MRLPALLLLPFALAAQDKLATLSGTVVNALTGEPVRHAKVTLRRYDVLNVPTAALSTDSNGAFAVTLEPGPYHIAAEHAGFLPAELGARGPNKPGPALTLTAGQKAAGRRIPLFPQGVISGRVVDEEGEPVTNVDVQVSRLQYMQGRRQLARSGSRITNDLGEYRIFGLSPGRYYLNAIYRPDGSVAGEGQYVSTFYPRTTDASAAAPLEITAGAQLGNVDITLMRLRTVTVKGRVTSEIGGANINMILSPANPLGGYTENGRGAPATPDGSFEFRNVVPGSYQLVAMESAPAKAYISRIPLQVGTANIEGLALTIHSPVAIAGQVKVEGETSENLSRIRVGLRLFDNVNNVVGPMPDATIQPDRSFQLTDLSAEHYGIFVSGLPDGFYVKSIRSADIDVQLAGLNLTGGAAPAPLEIVLSPHGGSLNGAVIDPKTQQPVTGATFVLVPQEKERRTREGFYRTSQTDQSGRLALKSIIPGEYKAFCWDDAPYGAWMDPDFMASQDSRGTPVTIGESATQSVQITLIVE